VSEQDFFFDDADENPEKPGKQVKSAKKASAAKSSSSSSGGSGMPQTVSVTVAGLLAVCTLLVGVIVGIAIPDSGSSDTAAPTATDVFSGSAPALSPEELSSGQMPEGHPDIGEMMDEGDAGTTTTESVETTAAE